MYKTRTALVRCHFRRSRNVSKIPTFALSNMVVNAFWNAIVRLEKSASPTFAVPTRTSTQISWTKNVSVDYLLHNRSVLKPSLTIAAKRCLGPACPSKIVTQRLTAARICAMSMDYSTLHQHQTFAVYVDCLFRNRSVSKSREPLPVRVVAASACSKIATLQQAFSFVSKICAPSIRRTQI